MAVATPGLPVASCCLDDERMASWERLGQFVVSRRLEMGYRQRQALADAIGVSLRTVGDIETGRRSKFDPTTIAALENGLGWETGSVLRIIEGGEPVMRKATPDAPSLDEQDEAVIRVMRSNIPEEQKRTIVRMLIDERREAERQRLRRAEDFIRLVGGEDS
jgi:transcriptional regulator with XRE-family HTH domain